eukprot:PITA_09627
MEEEIGAIEKNDTWELVDLPQGNLHVIGVKWIYKTKRNVEGKIERHKIRLVVKGYKQQHGRDYAETFVPVAMMETMRIVVAIVAQHNSKVYQMEIKSTFLNGVLKEEVYVVQSPGYEVEGQEDKLYRLRKALYVLQQALCTWYNRIDAYLLDNGFNRCDGEPTLYIKERWFMETPKKTHWQATKRILRHVNGKKLYGVLYTARDDLRLVGYIDSDWVGSVDDGKSTSGYLFHLGSGAIAWASKKQTIVSLSIIESEYVTTTTITCQAVWMRNVTPPGLR